MSVAKELTQINIKSAENKFTPTELLWKYLSYLPFFVIAFGISFTVGIYVIRYQQPVYHVSTRLFIKSNNDNNIGGSSRSSGNGGDLIENSLFTSKQVNLDNEIALISTPTIIQKIVQENHFNYHYYDEGKIRRSEIYKNAPFELISGVWADSFAVCAFFVKNLDARGGSIQMNDESQDRTKYRFHWGEWVNVKGNIFKLVLRPGIIPPSSGTNREDEGGKYYFAFLPAAITSAQIETNLSISPYKAKTTIIKLDLKGPNLEKCADELNALVAEYNRQSIEDKSTQLTNTIQFINQRLDYVTKELGSVETDLKDFKNSKQLIDISGQSAQVLNERAKLYDQLTTLEMQEQLFKMVDEEVRKMPAGQYKMIPSNIGLEGSQHSTIFDTYNALVIKKQREEPLVGINSPIMADLNAQLKIAYLAVLQVLSDYKNSLDIQKMSLNEASKKFSSMVNEVPGEEKTFVEIKRQQNVKEGLYLYLLQKREESAIATSSTVSNYQQLEKAAGSNIPLEPNTHRIYIFCIVFGLLIPIAFINIKDIFDDKIRSREHITSKTDMPIIAEIGHINNMVSNLVVADKSRNVIAEQFRVLRTNLSFLLQEKKTILITSTVSGEGKSFIALNLAAVLAISGKKVALLEFDLRKPRIIRNVGLEKKNVGLSNYLSKQTDLITDLYYILDNYPTLHIYACGPIPPNPAELMLGDRIKQLFEELKQLYDYIVVDSAPVGMVSDAFNILPYIDSSIYVVMQRKTLKKQLYYINDLFTSHQLQNVGMVINDVKVGPRQGYYGHQYGYGYGYGYRYGYGYGGKGYGEYFDDEKSTSQIKKLYKRIFSNRTKKKRALKN